MSELRDAVLRLILERAHERREEPFQLTSGAWSRDYIDAKRAMADGQSLALVARALLEMIEAANVDFDAAGGLTMGADPMAHAVAVLSGKSWFSVRKAAKEHGRRQRIEGAVLGPDTRVLLTDDVITTGSSTLQALDAVEEAGAPVVLAVSIVDRGIQARTELEHRGVPYRPLLTFEDLGIEPVPGD